MSEPLDAGSANTRIENILRDEIGLDASTVGSSLIQRAVQRRIEHRRMTSIDAYAKLIEDDAHEMQELIEQVVVPETYFFREPDAIADITRRALDARSTGENSVLHVLSVPCSSGEEPYSIAMSLLEARLPASSIAIDAIDVSVQAVRRAREGVYRSGAFRGDMSAWKKYFSETANGLEIAENVRELVQVAHGNLLSDSFQPAREQYDVIFCRNLLIYFDEAAQTRALAKLATLLVPDGLLVVGSADSFAARRAGFAPLPDYERSFLFRFRGLGPAVDAVPAVARRIQRHASALRPTKRPTPQPVAARPKAIVERATPSPRAASGRWTGATALAEVVRLANEGQLASAIELGERAIRDGIVSAELLSVVGTLHAATPQLDRAEACYRKALFLEPTNEDALLHLALLLEKRGEMTLASKLRSRARRALSFHTFVTP